MDTLSFRKLATIKNHPILRIVFYDIMQYLKLPGGKTPELSNDQLSELQSLGGTWDGAQWSGGQWSGGQWSGGQWSGADWSGSDWSGDY